MAEVSDAAKSYDKGLRYMGAARRIAAAASRLDAEDAQLIRRHADRLMNKGLALLTSVMKPARGNTAPPQPGS